jgi:soluble lytic murein transglycosylase-like protein
VSWRMLLLSNLVCSLLLGGSRVHASAEGPCLRAIPQAAARHGVPERLMRAIARVESGDAQADGRAAYAWAVGHRGVAHFPPTLDDAVAVTSAVLATGDTNLDLGCFQINVRWHSTHFRSAADMLDPDNNADYAARLLADHFARSGSWQAAAALYHSANPEIAARYMQRIEAALAIDGTDPYGPVVPTVAQFSIPTAAPGSLFASAGRHRPLFGHGQ